MPSTFMGIEIGKRSLIGHNLGLTTIGHNLSNASVEGYSRQRVEMKAFPPIYMPGLNRELYPGQIGQGMEATRIERIRDMRLADLPECRGCEFIEWCTRCPGQALVEDGSLTGRSSAACRLARAFATLAREAGGDGGGP